MTKKQDEDLAFALERSFLATEFLTWIWFRCEVEGGNFELPSGELSLAIDDALSLSSYEDDGLKATLRGGGPTRRPEAANALASGLLLSRARLIAARQSREWMFSLDGATLDCLGIKVVEPDTDVDPDDALADKLAAAEELRVAVDELYREFLALRLSADWESIELQRLKTWVREKLTHATANVGVV